MLLAGPGRNCKKSAPRLRGGVFFASIGENKPRGHGLSREQPRRSLPFLALREVYRRKSACGCRASIEVLDDQVVLQEDAGDLLLQRAWRMPAAKASAMPCWPNAGKFWSSWPPFPPQQTAFVSTRSGCSGRWIFFCSIFFRISPSVGQTAETLRAGLAGLVETIEPANTFAHRDFHSRNLLVKGGEIVMVDFQDSLLAPRYYDLVSLAYDSYLDLGHARGSLLSNLAARTARPRARQLRLTALQRNIKALGTFAYQTYDAAIPLYARYIPRTLRHIRSHLQELADPEFEVLTKYFSVLSN